MTAARRGSRRTTKWRLSNRMSFSIVGVFTAIIVLVFVAMIIAYAIN